MYHPTVKNRNKLKSTIPIVPRPVTHHSFYLCNKDMISQSYDYILEDLGYKIQNRQVTDVGTRRDGWIQPIRRKHSSLGRRLNWIVPNVQQKVVMWDWPYMEIKWMTQVLYNYTTYLVFIRSKDHVGRGESHTGRFIIKFLIQLHSGEQTLMVIIKVVQVQ